MSSSDNMDASSSPHTPKRSADQLSRGPNIIAKLAKKYDAKIQVTCAARAAKGLPTPGANPNEDTDFHVIPIGEKVAEQGPAAPKVTYNFAPKVTLRELMPENSVGSTQEADRLDQTFRAERLKFILMYWKLTATTPTELEWDIPDSDLYDQIIVEAAATWNRTMPETTLSTGPVWAKTLAMASSPWILPAWT